MKRLFFVRYPDGSPVTVHGKVQYFANKATAKAVRNDLSQQAGKPFTVSRGPDHIGPHGNKHKQRSDRRTTHQPATQEV